MSASTVSPFSLLQLSLKALPLSPLLFCLWRNVCHSSDSATTTKLRAATGARAAKKCHKVDGNSRTSVCGVREVTIFATPVNVVGVKILCIHDI